MGDAAALRADPPANQFIAWVPAGIDKIDSYVERAHRSDPRVQHAVGNNCATFG